MQGVAAPTTSEDSAITNEDEMQRHPAETVQTETTPGRHIAPGEGLDVNREIVQKALEQHPGRLAAEPWRTRWTHPHANRTTTHAACSILVARTAAPGSGHERTRIT